MKVMLKRDYNRIMPGKKHFLTPGKTYEVIGIEGDHYRIVNDRRAPRLGFDAVLYSPKLFVVVDASEPGDWISRLEDGCRYAYPQELGRVGFWEDYWEDYHDGVPEAIAAFRAHMAGMRRGEDE